MIGTIVNASAIVIAGLLALALKKPLPAKTQNGLKILLGVFTVFFGLRLTWLSLNGTLLQVGKQLAIVVLAMMLGRVAGHGLHLQKASNRVGQLARRLIAAGAASPVHRFSDGFNTCAVLFCAAPLAVLGAVQDGLSGYLPPLLIKAVMDGLATMAFAASFGGSVILSALPVLAWQGTITLLAGAAAPFLVQHQLVDSINATGGLLVFCVALVILEIKKLQLTDYLPSLVFAPLLTWLWR